MVYMKADQHEHLRIEMSGVGNITREIPVTEGKVREKKRINPFVPLPSEMVIQIFVELGDFFSLLRLSATCKRFRKISGHRDVVKHHLPLIDILASSILPGNDAGQKYLTAFHASRGKNFWRAMYHLRLNLRNNCFPLIPIEQLTQFEGASQQQVQGIAEGLGLRKSLVIQWKRVLEYYEGEGFTFESCHHYSEHSFHALLDALSQSPKVKKVTIRSKLDYEQLKLFSDYALKGKFKFEEMTIEPSGTLENHKLQMVIALISHIPTLIKIDLEDVELEKSLFAWMVTVLNRLPNLRYFSFQWPRTLPGCLIFGDYIVNHTNLEYLKIKKLTDEAFSNLLPYLLRTRIPTLNFRSGQLSDAIASPISTLIKRNRHLKVFDLVNNIQLTDEGDTIIIKEVRKRNDLAFSTSAYLFAL